MRYIIYGAGAIGGAIEADWLNGEVCLLGKIHGIPTPANETLKNLANRIAREKSAPGGYTADEVRALIHQAG